MNASDPTLPADGAGMADPAGEWSVDEVAASQDVMTMIAETSAADCEGMYRSGAVGPVARDSGIGDGAEPTSGGAAVAESLAGLDAGPLTADRPARRSRTDRAGGALPGPTVPPIPLRRRTVSGRYRNRDGTRLELRVDVDGARPTKRVSGDFYISSGGTLNYFGSFIVHSPTITVTATSVIIDGMGTFTWSAGAPRLRVTIPRALVISPPGAATAQFIQTNGTPGASYTCPFSSRYFRTVQYEEDHVASVTPFVSYNTGSLPSGGPARTLSVAGAYAEAGIEMIPTGATSLIPDGTIGPSWSNAELHAAMVAHFSLWGDDPAWRLWLLTAVLHDLGPGLLGIMFDQQGRQRQGCAVFHRSLAGTTPQQQRKQLYCCVHELGHCFNLFHSFHKIYMNPPQPNRLDALSWMNYPQNYVGPSGSGEAAFWAGFGFQFDDPELIHLRHAFRDNIVPGGNPFGSGAALQDPRAFADPVEDRSGLKLTLRSRPSYLLGEPVVVEIRLESEGRSRPVVPRLHPDFGFVQIGIKRPDGTVVAYEPMIDHCVIPETVALGAANPAVVDNAYIGYGHDGLYFQNPGAYEVRAVYHAPDGSRVVSNVLSLRVRTPVSNPDEEAADLMTGEEQGQLLYLLGSDAPELKRGNDAMRTLAERHSTHPLAVYAQLVRGVNAAREFKQITPDNQVKVRRPDEQGRQSLLTAINAPEPRTGARSVAAAGGADGPEGDAAEDTARRMLAQHQSQGLPAAVSDMVGAEAVPDRPRRPDRGRDAERDRGGDSERDPGAGPGEPTTRATARPGSRR